MDFVTAGDTKAYIGFGYGSGDDKSYIAAESCDVDEVSFYDQYMTAAEVRALYNAQ